MKILISLIGMIICLAIYFFVHIKADKNAEDPFTWGVYVGIAMCYIIAIIVCLNLELWWTYAIFKIYERKREYGESKLLRNNTSKY